MRLNERGAMLLETVLAMAIMTIAGLALIALVQKVSAVTFKAREQQTCGRMIQTGFSRVKNIDFYNVFAADSNSADYGLAVAYPYRGALDALRTTLASSKFDRFRVSVVFMRRDSSDSNGDALTSDLVPFTDANADLIDDYDANVRYFDQTADGTYWQTYVSGGRTVAEQPDTHVKRVTLDVYRANRLVCSQTELLSLEQFTASSNPSSEAVLSLNVSTPANNTPLYQQSSAGQTAALTLTIFKAYPNDAIALRADAAAPLTFSGETDALASVNVYVGASGILGTVSADAFGAFSGSPAGVTAALVEGNNLLTAQAVKSSYTSPIVRKDTVLDVASPRITAPTPTGAVATLAPYVAATLKDAGNSTTVVSGVCPDVVMMKINGSTVNFSYDSATDSPSGSTRRPTPCRSSPAAPIAYLEGGDYAGFWTQTWTFTASVPVTDNSAPSTADKSPIGVAASQLPVISVRVFDNQTGIIRQSIQLTLDGAVVVTPRTWGRPMTRGPASSPSRPPLLRGGHDHTVQITASHFAADPADKVTSTDSWGFSVP